MPICITGMHRSGTSMVARLLHASGLHLGAESDLMAPQPDNPDGFCEHLKFLAINEDRLNGQGGGWDYPPAPEFLAYEGACGLLRHRAEALVHEFEGHEPWGWKDPRN